MIKKIFKILLILMVVIAIFLAPIFYEAFEMYHSNYSDEKLTTIIEEVQANPGYVEIDNISDQYLEALIESEDLRFYSHHGFDIVSTSRAFFNNISAQKFQQGGSTITQQLAKNLFFSFEKKISRKLSELFVAFKIEKKLSKDEILELYCNIIYFGNGVYGIQSAAQFYYDKDNTQLSKMEIDALVKTIKSPNLYNPFDIDK